MELPLENDKKAPETLPISPKKIDETTIRALATELNLGRVKPVPNALRFDELLRTFEQYKDPNAKFEFAWLYLTGQRVSEALKTVRADVTLRELNGKQYVVVESVTEKNRQTPHRIIGFPTEGREKELVTPILAKLEKKEGRLIDCTRVSVWNHLQKATATVRAISQATNEWETINLKIYPHYLRHCRATHLATDYNYDHVRLMKYFGWTSSKMPDLYISGTWEFLAKGFV